LGYPVRVAKENSQFYIIRNRHLLLRQAKFAAQACAWEKVYSGQNVTDVRRHLRGSGVEVGGDRSYICVHKTKQQVAMDFDKDVTRHRRAHGKMP